MKPKKIVCEPEKPERPKRIVREPEACSRLGCQRTKFREDYRLNDLVADPNDPSTGPNVPNTNIPRLRPVPLGVRNVGYLDGEIDQLIDALAKLRDTAPVGTRPPGLEQRYELYARRKRLRAQAIAAADPELRTQLEQVERELRALEHTRSADTS